MKNLKKVLSLVLALAMALSLMTVAFAADASDYKDYNKVTYKEAVDVMTAVGVFNGTGDGSNFSPDGTLTREQAAQMAFNTMKADTMEYDSRTSVDINGAQVIIGNDKAYTVTTTRDWGKNIYDETTPTSQIYTVQFAEQYCRDLTLNGNKSNDDYGRPAHTWKYDKTTVGTYADEAVLTYTTAVKGTELANDIDDAGYEATGAVDQYRNNNVKNVTYSANEFAGMLKSSATIDGTGNGVVLEFYADENDVINRVVVTSTYLAEVTSITQDKASTNADERVLRVHVDGFPKTIELNADITAGFDSVFGNVEVGDYVLVTPKADNSSAETALTVAIPETVTAAITKVNTADKELTIGGEVYGIAKVGQQNYTADTKDVVVYLDPNGYVLAATNQGSDNDKAAVILKEYKGLVDGEITDMAQVITSDGEVHDWVLTVPSGLQQGSFVTYTVNDDDEYTLKADFAASYADGAAITKGSVTIEANDKSMKLDGSKTAYFASDVKFIFVNKDGKYTVKEGVQKVTDPTWVMGTIDMDGGIAYITTLFVSGGASSSTTSSDDIIFVAGKTGTTSVVVDGKTKTFTTYDAYINGEEVTDFYSSNANASGFYTKEVEDDSGAYVLASNTKYTATTGDLAVATETYNSYAGRIMITNAADYDTSTAVIIDASGNGLDSLSAMEELKGEGKTINVSIIYDADTNNAAYIYVTVAP